MILRTFEQPYLSHRSYLLGSRTAGEAIVIDPIRWTEQYLDAAAKDAVRITTVVDTHQHADYVSGARALAQKAGATLAVSGHRIDRRGFELAGRRRVRVLVAGDIIRVGELRLEVRHTPEHSPDHLSLLLVDESRGHGPAGIFTGDSPVPNDVVDCEHWPAHTGRADSTCDRPRYFEDVERINEHGAPPWCASRRRKPIPLKAIPALVAACALFLDTRTRATDLGFLPGSVVVPIDDLFLTRAGSVLRYGMPIHIVSDSFADAAHVGALLSLIGLDEVAGWIDAATMDSYARDGGALQSLRTAVPNDTARWLAEGALLLDVRGTPEWNAHHSKQALHTPLPHIIDDVRTVDRDIALVVYAEEPTSSIVAATALRRAGFANVVTTAPSVQAGAL